MTTTAPKHLPYGKQYIDEEDIRAVVSVLQSKMLTGGPAVDAFEDALANECHVPETVACSSGTAALHLASLALGIGQSDDDVVIVPAITFAATANAPYMAGAQIVFADVDKHTGLLTAQTLCEAYERAKKTGTPKAVFPVHLNGQLCEMDLIRKFAREHHMLIVEDACHAIGGRYHFSDIPGHVGDCQYSDATCFSFHPVKTITMGEGGAVSSTNKDILNRARLLRSHGISRDPKTFLEPEKAYAANGELNPWYYEMQDMGNNYRASDIHCALGLSQLRKLPSFISKRAELSQHYRKRLNNAHPALQLLSLDSRQFPGWHLFPVLIDYAKTGLDRAQLMQQLQKAGILTQVHYIPVPDLPYWKSRTPHHDYPNAQRYYDRVLSLPLFYDMSISDVDYIVDTLLGLFSIAKR